MAGNIKCVNLTVNVNQGNDKITDRVKTIASTLGLATINSSLIKSATDSFNADEDERDWRELEVVITLTKPVGITDEIKSELNKIFVMYIQEQYIEPNNECVKLAYGKTLNEKDITFYYKALRKQKNANVDDFAKEFHLFYTFGINESINDLMKFVKRGDVKNSNATLSKILKEKIDNRFKSVLHK